MIPERRAISVRGLVQGVGFRPYVHELATRFALAGFVRNHAGGVAIEVEGEPDAIARFYDALPRATPTAARIDALSWSDAPARGDRSFRIASSDVAPAAFRYSALTARSAATAFKSSSTRPTGASVIRS